MTLVSCVYTPQVLDYLDIRKTLFSNYFLTICVIFVLIFASLKVEFLTGILACLSLLIL